jgi:hypothetical protein
MRKFLLGLAALTAMANGIALAGVYFLGPKADIAAVEVAERQSVHNHVSGVHVIGNYALVLEWSGTTFDPAHNGYSAFKRVSAERWMTLYAHHQGPPGYQCPELVRHGVPGSIAHQLCTGWGDVGS